METRRKTQKTAPARRKKSSRKKKKGTPGAAILVVLLVIAMGLGGALLYMGYQEKLDEENRQAILSSETYHPGVSVSNYDISGLTFMEAKEKLVSVEKELAADIHFVLKVDGKEYRADQSYFKISYDTEAILQEALLLAREGSLFELQQELEDIKANGRFYSIHYTVEPDMEKFDALLEKIALENNVAPVDASFTVKEIGFSEATNGKAAVNLSYDLLIEDMEIPEGQTVDLQDLRFDFVEAVDGYGVDIESARELIIKRTEAREYGSIELTTQPIQSEVTIAYLKENFLTLRSSFYTEYSKREGRDHNMKKAAGLVYGTVLQPGEQFSTNGTLGDRTERGGWMMAPAVIQGGAATEDQFGGGVCQISTTLYNAVLRADLQVDYRRNHSTPSSYVDMGLDATIADSTTGNIDFTWTNNTEAPVYVFMWLNTSRPRTVNCEIFGVPFPEEFDEIEVTSMLIEEILPTADEFVELSSLMYPYWTVKNAAKVGYKYEAYKTYKLNGEVVKTVTVDTSTYRMHPNRYYVWPGYAGEPLYLEYKLEIAQN